MLCAIVGTGLTGFLYRRYEMICDEQYNQYRKIMLRLGSEMFSFLDGVKCIAHS